MLPISRFILMKHIRTLPISKFCNNYIEVPDELFLHYGDGKNIFDLIFFSDDLVTKSVREPKRNLIKKLISAIHMYDKSL